MLVGNLGEKPELRMTNNGISMTTLSIATSKSYKQEDGNWGEKTYWNRAVVWGKRAENCTRYLDKGDRVYVEGFLRSQKWKDDAGVLHWSSEIATEDVKFLGSCAANKEKDLETKK